MDTADMGIIHPPIPQSDIDSSFENDTSSANSDTTVNYNNFTWNVNDEEALNVQLENKDSLISKILDHVENSPAVFKNQQRGEPDLTKHDKRSLACKLLKNSPLTFLDRFAPYMLKCHFEFFFNCSSHEVVCYAMQLKNNYHHSNKKLQQKNRRYEALKRLEAQGSYFSESEMEKREPLLYYHLVGQYLTDREKLIKNRQKKKNVIPSFSNFLIEKMELDEIATLRKCQQEEETRLTDELSEDDDATESLDIVTPRWGDDWIDVEKAKKEKMKKRKRKKHANLPIKEKDLLLQEFKTLMHSNFLNGLDPEFDYNTVDQNPEYDCLQALCQDEEDRYFDEESCDNNICTDTGVDDY